MRRNISLLLLCLGLLLLAGCGYNGNATSTGSGLPGTATVVSRVTPGATSTPTTTTGPLSTSGHVSVQLSTTGYHIHDPITVTITNGTSQSIGFADHQSDCTIVLLQRQNTASWTPIGICRLMTLTRFLSLDAGKSTTVSLRAPATGWQTGSYRVLFSYGGTHGNGNAASSAVFQIH